MKKVQIAMGNNSETKQKDSHCNIATTSTLWFKGFAQRQLSQKMKIYPTLVIRAIRFCVKIKQIMKILPLKKILLCKPLNDKFPTIMAAMCKVTNFDVRMHTLQP